MIISFFRRPIVGSTVRFIAALLLANAPFLGAWTFVLQSPRRGERRHCRSSARACCAADRGRCSADRCMDGRYRAELVADFSFRDTVGIGAVVEICVRAAAQ